MAADELPAADVLDALIEALATAPCGSRELDVRLDYGLGVMLSGRPDLATVMIREGISWPTVSEVLDSRVPAYTTSLDAAVEGENIVFTIRSERRGQWAAMHRARSGKEILAWAASEPLARRLAALKGMSSDAADERARRGDGESPSEPQRSIAGTSTGDWKILF